MRRLLPHRCRFEFELPFAIVPRIWVQEYSRRPNAIARDSMAVRTMLAIQAPRITMLIAPDGPRRDFQVRQVHNLAELDSFYGWQRRIIGRPKQRLHRFIDALQLIARKSFLQAGCFRRLVSKRRVPPKIRLRRPTANQGDQPNDRPGSIPNSDF